MVEVWKRSHIWNGDLSGIGYGKICTRKQLLNHKGASSDNTLRIFCRLKVYNAITNNQGEIDLKLPTFKPTVIDYKSLFDSGKFSNFIIVTKDKEFKVHRSFLAAASPVFESMLTINMRESSENLMTISDISSDLIQEMLNFIYAGNVNNQELIAAELLSVANRYQI